MPRPQTPALAADTIIELPDEPGRPIVLIERRFPPVGYALPGGFVDVGEPVEVAAVREAREETGLEVTLTGLLGCYSAPERDERGHTVTLVYVAKAHGRPRAGDDAGKVLLRDPANPPEPLVFDHALVLRDYLRFRSQGEPAPLRHV
ncbi:NUDIX hydrolase [Ectothiorhodospiraceae bacterium 2226]|nr:NUDIX hydrolase [Ectothiorhodospiraceae bacterium 2226]